MKDLNENKAKIEYKYVGAGPVSAQNKTKQIIKYISNKNLYLKIFFLTVSIHKKISKNISGA